MPINPATDISGKLLWLRAKDCSGSVNWTDQSGLSQILRATGGPGATLQTSATPSSGQAVRFTNTSAYILPQSSAPISIRGRATASTVFNTTDYLPENALDTVGVVGGGTWASSTLPAWWRVRLETAETITSYRIMPASQYPIAWTFEGSNDGSSWTTLDTRSGQVLTSGSWSSSYTFSNSTAYLYYRFNITSASGGSIVNVAEFELNGVANSVSGNHAGEVWAVLRENATAGTNVGGPWDLGDNSTGNFYPLGSDGKVYEAAGASTRQSFTPTVSLTSWRLYRISQSGSSWAAYLDGTSQATASIAANWLSTTPQLGQSARSGVQTNIDIAEILILDHQATSGEVADLIAYFNSEHGLTVPGGTGSGVTGAVAATASSPTLSVAGVLPTMGTVSASASSPTLSVAGTVTRLGQVDATAPSPSLSVTGDVAGIASGVVSAAAPAPTLAVTGDVPTPITGTVAAVAPSPGLAVSDSTLIATLPVGLTVEAGALSLLDVVVLPGTDVPVGVGVDPGASVNVEPLPGTSIPVWSGLVARPTPGTAPDPRGGGEQWRYVVTELDGTPLGELTDITHDAVEDGVNEPATMPFTIGRDDPARALIRPHVRQCQVWEGDRLLLRGPILAGRNESDGSSVTYRVHDPSWYWRDGRARIGRIPKLNLLQNGDFTMGLAYWTRGHDADSIPASNPTVTIVDDPYTDGGKAAQIVGVETTTETELQSSAVFYPNRPYAWEPLAAGFRPEGPAAIDAVANAMPNTAGLKVTIVGHTANDGTGPGWDLSLRRANAAKARVLALRPGAIVTTKGVGYTQPNPSYPVDSQQQRRVVISYEATVAADYKGWIRQTVEVIHPKAAAYGLEVTAAAWLKVADAWEIEDANMVSVKVVARRKATPTVVWDEASASLSDTDPVERWKKDGASVTIPADDRAYLIDVYLYAPAALTRYTRVVLEPQEMLYFWGADQADVVKGIVEHMQDPSANMGQSWPFVVGTRTPLTGVPRDKAYAHAERMPVDTALDDLASLHRGVDIDTLYTPTEVKVATFYPRQGQTIDYQLVQGGNVAKVEPASTNDVAALIIAQAQDTTAVRDEAYALDTSSLGGLVLKKLITAEQGTPINELDETADGELAWSKISTPSFWLTIDPESVQEVKNTVQKGDVVRMLLDVPDEVDALVRVMKRSNHPGEYRLLVSLGGF